MKSIFPATVGLCLGLFLLFSIDRALAHDPAPDPIYLPDEEFQKNGKPLPQLASDEIARIGATPLLKKDYYRWLAGRYHMAEDQFFMQYAAHIIVEQKLKKMYADVSGEILKYKQLVIKGNTPFKDPDDVWLGHLVELSLIVVQHPAAWGITIDDAAMGSDQLKAVVFDSVTAKEPKIMETLMASSNIEKY